MTGRLVDLSDPDARLPSTIVLDSNVVITWMETFYPSRPRRDLFHATTLFDHFTREGRQAILPPAAYGEVIHAAIKAMYVGARAS